MTRIIKNKRIVDDPWRIVTLAGGETPESVEVPETRAIVPLSVWLARKDEILARGEPAGVWLDAHEGPEAIAADLAHFALIAVNFPKFSDGRGYSTARLLRERHGYSGELRAIGDVLQDQLYFMKRCGFDAYAVRADKDIAAALAGLEEFPESYQAAADQPLPLFRRRSA
ncbi:MAG: DUF934 domain-containing protein [Candidatus Accumulibacter sp.]|jgi:uncharacterized protein (DUF934 family)|nr:DUF934 domain-containing protein [Accumulibacter sp.]